MLERRAERGADEVVLQRVLDGPSLQRRQQAVEGVHVEESVGRSIVALVAATRASAALQLRSSPRGSLALLALARALAAVRGRAFVTPDDVKAIAVPALGHRLVLSPERWLERASADDVVRECLAKVPTPETMPQERTA